MNPFFHEFDVSNFVHSVLKPGDVFVDVGAYAGSYTLAAAKIVGPKGKVVSIEPNPETLAYLKENVSLNRQIDVVKIDTEGQDLQVLLGGQRALSRTRYVVVEQNTDAERKLLSRQGFGISDLTPSGYLLATKTHPPSSPRQIVY